MPETTTMPEVLTLEVAARFLKLSPEAVARQAEAGQIPGRRWKAPGASCSLRWRTG